jgi:hypothetical protein
MHERPSCVGAESEAKMRGEDEEQWGTADSNQVGKREKEESGNVAAYVHSHPR